MEILKPEELKKKYRYNSWVVPYEKIITMVDGDLVEIVEYHPCVSGSHWIVNQYKNNSKLIKSAYRDGNRQVFLANIGKDTIDLRASICAAGVESVSIEGNEVKVTHGGLAGAGVGAVLCRGMAEGVRYIELINVAGGSKLGRAVVVTEKMEKVVVGVDDTDKKEEGATWTTAHNIATELQNEGFQYLDHVIVQLYPHNPNKTQNCVSIALTFAVKSEDKKKFINKLVELLERDTLSDKTAIAILEGLKIPKELRKYSMDAKTRMISLEEAEYVAEKLGIKLIAITGDQGKIGALAALGLYNDLEEAVKVYY